MRKLFGCFRRNRGGATAVEFAIICPLIFASALGTFEVGRVLYVRNHAAEACAFGARALMLNRTATTSQIQQQVAARFNKTISGAPTVNIVTETIDGQAFRRIEVVYTHNFIVKLNASIGSVTLKVKRYAPVVT
jgi:Flp pilus assembly protein TadG